MPAFLVLSLGLAAVVVISAIAIPVLPVAAGFWLILLPFRVLLKLVFGVVGALLGLAVAPLLLMLVAVSLVGAFVTAFMALFAPLIPLGLLALLVWGIYRGTVRRPTPVL